MRCYGWILGLALCAGLVRAEEPKPDAKPDAAKPADLDVNYRGKVLPKAKDAPEKAVVSFVIILKKFDIIDENKTVNLFATGEVATKLLELAKSKSRAEISGTIVEGGINVTDVDEFTGKKKAKVAAKPQPVAGNGNGNAQPAKTDGKNDAPPKTKPSDEEF